MDNRELARKNVKMAVIHGLIALGFLLAFFWTMSHK